MVRVAVGGEPIGQGKTFFPGSDRVQHSRARQPAEHLGDDIRHKFTGLETASGHEPEGHGRVQVTTRNMTNGIGHRQNREAESKSHTNEADADIERGAFEFGADNRRQNGAAAAAKDEPESADELGRTASAQLHKLSFFYTTKLPSR